MPKDIVARKTAVIIGAGPAGLTAAYELLMRSNIQPIVLESDDIVGGIARTVNHKGNRIDLGGHRFFTKSGRVMDWWLSFLPLQKVNGSVPPAIATAARNAMPDADFDKGPDPETTDLVMLVRTRLSRILFRRKLYDYPLSLSPSTLRALGPWSVVRIGVSYLRAKLLPIRRETSLEDFFINRFGRELYQTFFKDYTEKVWGEPCIEIQPAWGAQRIKGLSIGGAITDALRRVVPGRNGHKRLVETSLIEFFLYPKYGPGQLWEKVAARVRSLGGMIEQQNKVVGLDLDGCGISGVHVVNKASGKISTIPADYVFSTMPVRDLVLGLNGSVPAEVRRSAEKLRYRDFVTVGLLLQRTTTPSGRLPDSWIYIQENYVRVGRIQIINNWSPFLVRDPDHVWLGLEYFCQEGDDLWTMADEGLIDLGLRELKSLGLAHPGDFLDGKVVRMPKAYPAYFKGYEQFPLVREYLDRIENLYLIGRNGMHRYNNMDHSMLTAMTAVDNVVGNIASKENIWNVNTDADYHERK